MLLHFAKGGEEAFLDPAPNDGQRLRRGSMSPSVAHHITRRSQSKKKAPQMRGSNGRNEEGWTTFTADHLLVLDAVECDVPHIRIGLRRDGMRE
jgi:hypothetical protein